jgi:hypothetical protein
LKKEIEKKLTANKEGNMKGKGTQYGIERNII